MNFEENQANNIHDNEPISALSHFIGLIFSIAGLALLVIFAVLYGKTGHIVGFSIFGSGLILLYLASATYHFISKTHPAKAIFKTIDYSMIYILIASTYTPLVLVIPQRGWGWGMFGVIWGLACVGIALSILIKKDRRLFSAVLYITMGWLAVILLPVLLKSLPLEGIWWLVLGGILYTFGVIFLALERIFSRKGWFGMHEIFHLFVMGGSFSHFWFMFKYVLYI